MKITLPIVIVIAALVIWSAILHQQTRRQGDEIAKLRQDSREIETLRVESIELKQYRDQALEVERARKEQRELIKLRNEVSTLRTEKQKLAASLAAANSTIGALKENIRQPTAPPPGQISGSYQLSDLNAVRNACINNLRMIDGAMQQWALENKKTSEDIPAHDDLLPYLGGTQRPWSWTCPGGGSYIIGPIKDSPRCSLPGHILP